MAAKACTISGQRGYTKYTWAAATEADTMNSQEVDTAGADRCVAVTGTFGSATVLIRGSIDGTNFFTLTDPQGNSLSFTAAGLKQISENVQFIQPTHSGGSSESVVVRVFGAIRKPR